MTTIIPTQIEPQIASIVDSMNNTLGLYIPEGVEDKTGLRLYDQFFTTCRKLYFYYRMLTQEEVQKHFIEFYNADYIEKNAIINRLENKLRILLEMNQEEYELHPEEYEDTAVELYLAQGDKRQKAELLFFLANGFEPKNDNELKIFMQMVDEIENAVTTVQSLPDNSLVSEVVDEDASNLSTTPEEVISRYLKGSGVYDPSLRNSGFRVDTDIERPTQQ